MKTFPRATASSDPLPKAGHRAGLLLMLALYSDPRLFSVVRGAVGSLTETLGFPAAQRRGITRAVDEALANIVRHSYDNRPGESIAIYFRSTQRGHPGAIVRGLEIILCDRGPAIDPRKLHGRPLEEIRPGGLGLHLIRQAMDTVEFTRKGSMNQLRLVKYLTPASTAS